MSGFTAKNRRLGFEKPVMVVSSVFTCWRWLSKDGRNVSPVQFAATTRSVTAKLTRAKGGSRTEAIVLTIELGEDSLNCAQCNTILEDAYLVDDRNYCESCAGVLVHAVVTEAEAHAREACKVTAPLPEYDPELEYKCPHEEYENGAGNSYTENSCRACCRHECTNYDELIRMRRPKSLEPNPTENPWHHLRIHSWLDRLYKIRDQRRQAAIDARRQTYLVRS